LNLTFCLTKARELGLGELRHVTADAATKENPFRPHNAKLDCSTLVLMGIDKQTPFAKGIHCLDKWLPKRNGN
jgi:hypothetical protein